MNDYSSTSALCEICGADYGNGEPCEHQPNPFLEVNSELGQVFSLDMFAGMAEAIEPVWGDETATIWAEGQYMMVYAGTGAGKTTLAAQLIAARCGVMNDFIGYPVKEGKRALYLSADRPTQFMSMVADMFTPIELEAMADRFYVMKEAPDEKVYSSYLADVAHYYNMAQMYECDTIVIDSLFNIVTDPNDFNNAKAFTEAVNYACNRGVQCVILHHARKATSEGDAGSLSLDRVYGAQSFTASAGSVYGLGKQAEGRNVTLRQLKSPKGDLPDIEMFQDWGGTNRFVTVADGGKEQAYSMEPMKYVELSVSEPATVGGYAKALANGGKVTQAVRKRAERGLKSLENGGFVSVEMQGNKKVYTKREWNK